MNNSTLTIIHVDMDAFYASVEQRDRPELRGKPVIVGGSPESRGVVSTASYEARQYGVHSAMPTSRAKRLCPQGIFLPVRMKHYANVASQIREIFHSFSPLVEPLSLDEAFIDVKGCEGLFGSAIEIGKSIKARIQQETNLIASVGVASCKFLAKLASDLEKPSGFVVIEPDQCRDILDPLSVSRLPGVGAKGLKRLETLGIHTIGQLATLSIETLKGHLGKSGEYLWHLAQGIDQRAVVPDEQAKRISSETTFAQDIGDRESLRSWLLRLTEQVGMRVRRHGYKARTIDIKIRTSAFQTHTRSQTLNLPSDLTEELWQTVRQLFEERVPDSWLPIRLIGVGASGLLKEEESQGDLFEQDWRTKQRSLDHTLDEIRQQFGQDAVQRAGQWKSKRK